MAVGKRQSSPVKANTAKKAKVEVHAEVPTDPLQAEMKPVLELLELADLPETCKDMLKAAVVPCLRVDKENRHVFQAKIVDVFSSVFANTEAGKRADVTQMTEHLASVSKEHEEAKQKAESTRVDAQQAKEKSDALENSVKEAEKFVESKKEARQAELDKHTKLLEKGGQCEAEREGVQKVINDLFHPLESGEVAGRNWQKRDKMCKELVERLQSWGLEESLGLALPLALREKVAQRGDFAKTAIKFASDLLTQRMESLAKEKADFEGQAADQHKEEEAAQLEVEKALAALKASEEESIASQNAWLEAETSARSEAKAVKSFEPRIRDAQSQLEAVESRLASFSTSMGMYAALKERTASSASEPVAQVCEEPETKKAKVDHESYYKVIDGQKYDRALLEMVEKFAADGQVGYPEAKTLWHEAEDGKGVTDIEKATLEYAMRTYKFSEKAANFVKTYLEVGVHKSYYKVIDGVKYDRHLLEEAEVFVADGQISVKEAKLLFTDAQDGKGLTGTEKDSLEHILKTMKFTDKARSYLESQLKGPSPKSYYKIIDGVKYDHALLLECEDAAKDGLVSEAEAHRLYIEACDGKGVTEIELNTLKYAVNNFKFSDPAKAFIEACGV